MRYLKWLAIEIEIQIAILTNNYPSNGLLPYVWVSRMRVRQKNILKGLDL